MYIKLETGNSRLGVKHETSVDRSMSHLPPANGLCEIFNLSSPYLVHTLISQAYVTRPSPHFQSADLVKFMLSFAD
jgi:hypothetical protein